MATEQPLQTLKEGITPDNKKLLDSFYAKRNELKSQINLHVAEISRLEGDLVQIRPRIGNGQKLCEICDVISMKFTGFEPDTEDYHWYTCSICGHEYYEKPEN
jgi:hypothetical protein